jgi:hypothetical protein
MSSKTSCFLATFLRAAFGLIAGITVAFQATAEPVTAKLNELSAAEKKAGWILLFDGKTTAGWRGFKTEKPADNWSVQEQSLHNSKTAHGGRDLITDASYNDFELQWDWKVAPNANSGLKYFVTEERDKVIGHEYQMIDDDHYKEPIRGTKNGTGSLYDVLPPKNLQIKPVGEFNHSRILVHGMQVEHWLNGVKILEYELGGQKLKTAIAASKFKEVTGFGEKIQGHLLLQDHGGEVWFRNLKLRPLSVK